ncbi:acyl-CoA dehydrogenase family protein [Streptosporangium sp. G11]|uniref:acyl-CoA dehydrogenase family protein n=1 Tax=Streptosporangium sp. G11 TaxID=3436926 RepID=UPI003EB84602
MSSEIRIAVKELLAEELSRGPGGAWTEETGHTALAGLVAQGWTKVGLPEELGGEGGTLHDACEVVAASATLALPSPLADVVLVTNRLMAGAGLPLPPGATYVVPVDARAAGILDGAVTFSAARVPWARHASHLLAVMPTAKTAYELVIVDRADAEITPGANLAGEARDDVEVVDATPLARSWPRPWPTPSAVGELGALARSVQIAAALERALELSVAYCSQRVQFGRPLSRLATVQHELAALAGEVAAARAAVSVAAETQSAAPSPADLRSTATAKIRTASAASTGSRIAHQLHGAIGVTREYELSRLTVAMWSWRDEYGSESAWAERLAADALAAETGVWDWVTV